MPKPERRPTNPLIERAREALGSRPAEPPAEGEGDAASEQTEETGQTESAAPGRSSELRRSVTEAGQRIQEIVDVAEKVAAEIEADARANADRYLGDRVREADRLFGARADELEGITASLLDRAEGLRREADALTAEVARTVERLRAQGASSGRSAAGPSEAPKPPEQPSTVTEDEEGHGGSTSSAGFKPKEDVASASGPRPVAYPGKAAEEAEADAASVPEDALLRATQMAVAGNSRDEIETALRSEFGVSDPGSVTDEILGPQ